MKTIIGYGAILQTLRQSDNFYLQKHYYVIPQFARSCPHTFSSVLYLPTGTDENRRVFLRH